MQPFDFLYLLLAFSAAAAAMKWFLSRLQARRLRRLAHQWNMHFVPDDRFKIAQQVCRQIPLVGATDLRIRNLMFRTDAGCRDYLFTCDFVSGVLFSQRRRRLVAALHEPDAAVPAQFHAAQFAPQNVGVLEQYRRLHDSKQGNRL